MPPSVLTDPPSRPVSTGQAAGGFDWGLLLSTLFSSRLTQLSSTCSTDSTDPLGYIALGFRFSGVLLSSVAVCLEETIFLSRRSAPSCLRPSLSMSSAASLVRRNSVLLCKSSVLRRCCRRWYEGGRFLVPLGTPFSLDSENEKDSSSLSENENLHPCFTSSLHSELHQSNRDS